MPIRNYTEYFNLTCNKRRERERDKIHSIYLKRSWLDIWTFEINLAAYKCEKREAATINKSTAQQRRTAAAQNKKKRKRKEKRINIMLDGLAGCCDVHAAVTISADIEWWPSVLMADGWLLKMPQSTIFIWEELLRIFIHHHYHATEGRSYSASFLCHSKLVLIIGERGWKSCQWAVKRSHGKLNGFKWHYSMATIRDLVW